MKITTDNKMRWLEPFYDLPEKWQKEFDYVDLGDQDSPRFVKYKGQFYDAVDTQRIVTDRDRADRMGWAMYVDATDPLAAWHTVASDSFFSWMVFRFSEDFDKVVVGVCTS